jgi:hypothetical protein
MYVDITNSCRCYKMSADVTKCLQMLQNSFVAVHRIGNNNNNNNNNILHQFISRGCGVYVLVANCVDYQNMQKI